MRIDTRLSELDDEALTKPWNPTAADIRHVRLSMGHHINGFIARGDELLKAAERLPGALVKSLSMGYGFLPVTEDLAGDDDPAPFGDLERLTTRLGAWAEEVSGEFPLAYVETEYFGGEGSQAAMVWAAGEVVFGPVRTSDLREGGNSSARKLLDGAINRALRHLGVNRGAVRDEFDALGLGQHRSNESWMSEDGHGLGR